MISDKTTILNELIKTYKVHRGLYEDLLQRISDNGKILFSDASECDELRTNLALLARLNSGLRVLAKSNANAHNIAEMKRMLSDFIYYTDLAAQNAKYLIRSERAKNLTIE